MLYVLIINIPYLRKLFSTKLINLSLDSLTQKKINYMFIYIHFAHPHEMNSNIDADWYIGNVIQEPVRPYAGIISHWHYVFVIIHEIVRNTVHPGCQNWLLRLVITDSLYNLYWAPGSTVQLLYKLLSRKNIIPYLKRPCKIIWQTWQEKLRIKFKLACDTRSITTNKIVIFILTGKF